MRKNHRTEVMSHNRRVDDSRSNVDVSLRLRRKCRRRTRRTTASIRARANLVAAALQAARLLCRAGLPCDRRWVVRRCLRRLRQADSRREYWGVCSADLSGSCQRNPVDADSAAPSWRTWSFARPSITLPLRPRQEVLCNRRPILIFFVPAPSHKTMGGHPVMWIFAQPRAHVNHKKAVLRPFTKSVFHRALHRVLQVLIQNVGVCNHSVVRYALDNSGICRRTEVG